ncbi:MAG: hypothetical protein ACOYL6_16165 [Bacteriovoracaceae bacterium]
MKQLILLLIISSISTNLFAQSGCDNTTSFIIVNDLLNEIRQVYFPELQTINISLKEFKSDAYFLQAQVDLDTLYKSKSKRKYFVEINPDIYSCSPNTKALKAIIVHEMEHIKDYHSMSSANIVALGIKYTSSKKFRARYERATDEKALSKGQGLGLIDYRLWIYSKLTAKQLKLKKLYYLSPEEIQTWLETHSI